MKHKYVYTVKDKIIEKTVTHIPIRYILAVIITVFEIAAIIGIVAALCFYVPLFYIAAWLTEIYCVIKIISSDDNPDYKVPWLLFVLIIPIAGFMLYFMFYSRKLKPKFIKRLKELKESSYSRDDSLAFDALSRDDPDAAAAAKMLVGISRSRLFLNTKQEYFALGEDMFERMLTDLESARKFIFLEYFIIEEGVFFNSILDILKKKAAEGVEVKLVYDDIGCMTTLSGGYYKKLQKWGISAVPFSMLRGNADSEFNNRSHRKILVIDGKIGYTGGINLADEYINKVERFGHWKDTGIRLEGEAVWELTRLFFTDYGINVKSKPEITPHHYPKVDTVEKGYVIPFGDGPRPLYTRRVGKSVIQNMLYSAKEYVYMTTPYLIIDNDLCTDIENTALRGVDVRIILPHIPDKKIVFSMTRSYYKRLMDAGVGIYEYEPGFIHAKSYLADDKTAIIGTINLDYRSLVHHFENGVWMYDCSSIKDIKEDIDKTLKQCIKVTPDMLRLTVFKRIFRSVVRIFAPML